MTRTPHSGGNLVILAGGVSSRMKRSAEAANPAIRPDLLQKAKAMIPVGPDHRPLLDYLLYNAAEAGYGEVVIVVGERDESIESYYEREGGVRAFPSLRISYVRQPVPEGRRKPLGTADALLRALEATPAWRDGRCTVCNSDNLYSVNSLSLLLADTHRNALIDYDRKGLNFTHERIAQFAVIKKDQDGYVHGIVEKPTGPQMADAAGPDGRIGVSMNIFRFSYGDIVEFLRTVPIHPVRLEKELPVAVNMLAQARPKSVYAIPLSEHVIDLTTQADIPDVRRYLATAFPRFSPGRS